MKWKNEWRRLAILAGAFLACVYLPVEFLEKSAGLKGPVLEALSLVRWYAREHVLTCLVPAFFIAGAIAVFVSQASVMKYFRACAPKVLSYGVASVSGTILAVCSCTVLPLFAGIYKMGAGLGPACAFLYSGPAINVLAIVLTARILGLELGVARAVGAIVFSVVIGLSMHLLFRGEEIARCEAGFALANGEKERRPLWQTSVYFALMVAILVFANWGKPDRTEGFWHAMYSAKWILTAISALGLGAALVAWFGLRLWKFLVLAGGCAVLYGLLFVAERQMPDLRLSAAAIVFVVGILGFSVETSLEKGEIGDWFDSSWGFAKQILPLLLIGVLVAGFLLGRPGHEGLIPSAWIARAVGGNSLLANFFAAFAGAFMYFATLTEVPILQGLIGSGMGKGPALALLLAGPALSLPSVLVIRGVMGTKKTAVYVTLVVAMATVSGMLYGTIFR